MSQALCFNDVRLTPVSHQNCIWIKASELARALGYAREDTVSRLYERNADEFTPEMTQVIEIVDTVNLTVTARVFSLRGCHLLSMFARTPIAKAFRKWVLDVLDKMTATTATIPDTSTLTPSARAELKAIVDAKLSTYPADVQGKARSEIWVRFNRHFKIAEYAQLPMCQMPDARDYLVEMKPKALAAIEAKPQKALCSVPTDTTIMDDIRAFAEEVEQARQKNMELQQHLFGRISEIMARIGVQYIGRYDTPDAVGFAINGVCYVREACRQAVMETHRPSQFCGPAALMAEFSGMIGGEYKKASKRYTEVN